MMPIFSLFGRDKWIYDRVFSSFLLVREREREKETQAQKKDVQKCKARLSRGGERGTRSRQKFWDLLLSSSYEKKYSDGSHHLLPSSFTAAPKFFSTEKKERNLWDIGTTAALNLILPDLSLSFFPRFLLIFVHTKKFLLFAARSDDN